MNDYSKDILALYHKAKANNKAHETLINKATHGYISQ